MTLDSQTKEPRMLRELGEFAESQRVVAEQLRELTTPLIQFQEAMRRQAQAFCESLAKIQMQFEALNEMTKYDAPIAEVGNHFALLADIGRKFALPEELVAVLKSLPEMNALTFEMPNIGLGKWDIRKSLPMPALPEFHSVEEIVRRVVREEFERLAPGPELPDEPADSPYGSDGIKRQPGFER